MVAPVVVQTASAVDTDTITFSAATAGNLLIASIAPHAEGTLTAPAGWTELHYTNVTGAGRQYNLCIVAREAVGGETSVSFTAPTTERPVLLFAEVSGADFSGRVADFIRVSSASPITISLESPADDTLALAFFTCGGVNGATPSDVAPVSGWSELEEDQAPNSPPQWPIGALAEGDSAYSDGATVTSGWTDTTASRKVVFLLLLPPATGGGTTVTGSGALSAQSSTTSGAGEREVAGSGAIAAQSATVSGSGEREITGAGAAASQSATVSGTGAVGGAITGTGALQAQGAAVSGAGQREVTSSGAIEAQPAAISGAGSREITGTGAVAAQSAVMSGAGEAGAITVGAGSLAAQAASVSGSGAREIAGAGAVAAQAAAVAGTGTRIVVGSGALVAQAASVWTPPMAPIYNVSTAPPVFRTASWRALVESVERKPTYHDVYRFSCRTFRKQD